MSEKFSNSPKTEFEALKQKLAEAYKEVYYIHPFTFNLPGAVLYPEGHKSVMVEPLKGKHEKLVMANLDFKTIVKNTELIIEDTVKWENGDSLKIQDISIQDYLAIAFLQKVVTYQRDLFQGEVACSQCKQKYVLTIDSKNIHVDNLELKNTNFEVTLPIAKDIIKYTYFQASYFEKLLMSFVEEPSLKSINLLAYAITSINDVKYPLEYYADYLDLLEGGRDYDTIKNAVSSLLDYGVRNTLSTTCPHCQTINNVTLDVNGKGEVGSIIPFRFFNSF